MRFILLISIVSIFSFAGLADIKEKIVFNTEKRIAIQNEFLECINDANSSDVIKKCRETSEADLAQFTDETKVGVTEKATDFYKDKIAPLFNK